jgi:hypothetical protein
MNTDVGTSKSSDISLRTSAIVAGLSLLFMAVLAPIANFGVIEKLIVPGNAASTANNIMASAGLFRIGIGFFLIVAILDVVAAWALFILLKPVNRSISLLAAWLRVVYAAILAFALSNLLIVLRLLNGANYLGAFETNQLYAQVMLFLNAFTDGWDLGLLIFGLHLSLLGYLAFKSGYIPKILGILVIVAGLGYTADGVGIILSPNYTFSLAMFAFIGEVLLIFWLLWNGIKGFDKELRIE